MLASAPRTSTLLLLAFAGFAHSAGAASLVVTPASPINLGGTQIGMTISKELTVANMGQVKVTVMSADITVGQSAYELANVPIFPVALSPGTSFNFTVKFTPQMNGVTPGTVTLASNDPNNPMLAVQLSGYAGPAAISLDAGSVAFGNVNLGAASDAQVINVQNSGFSPLQVTDIQMGGMVGDFVLDKKAAITSIPPMMQQPFTVTFKPTVLGNRSATVTVVSGAGSKTVTLLGSGTSAMMKVTPAMLAFGGQRVTMKSAAQPVTVSNMGTGTLKIMTLAFSGKDAASFSVTGQMAPISVGANSSVMLPVVCTPANIGALAATLTIAADVGMAQVAVTCTGVAPMISVDHNMLDFGSVDVMQTAMAQAVTITNKGTDVLNVNNFSVVGANLNDFNITDQPQTPLTIQPKATLTFHVNFVPSGGGAETSDVLIESDDPLMMAAKVHLTGKGIMSAYSLAPMDPWDFMTVPVNSSSPPHAFTVTNTGDGPITVASAGITGMNASAFTTDFKAPVMLDMNKSLDINVSFEPTMVGMAMATFNVQVQNLMPTTVDLTGTGSSPTIALNPPAFDFSTVLVGMSSVPQAATITNTGTSALTIANIASTDPAFVIDKSATMLMLPAHMATTFTVTFSPTVAAMKTAQIGVTLSGQPKPSVTLSVSGDGVVPMPKMGKGCDVGGRPERSTIAAALGLAALLALSLLRRRRFRA